jgi:hypothetical protein
MSEVRAFKRERGPDWRLSWSQPLPMDIAPKPQIFAIKASLPFPSLLRRTADAWPARTSGASLRQPTRSAIARARSSMLKRKHFWLSVGPSQSKSKQNRLRPTPIAPVSAAISGANLGSFTRASYHVRTGNDAARRLKRVMAPETIYI